ncbi:MAG: hypothetical protein GY729_19205 [Desulfobacteraceae bacterium]|nr:hypothetical protein [Desulfobacteraceae bacterium]
MTDQKYTKNVPQIQLPLPIAGIMPLVKSFVVELIPSATDAIRTAVQETLSESVADIKEQKEDIRILQDEIKEQKVENQALKNILSELENKINQLFSQEALSEQVIQSKGKKPDKKEKDKIKKKVKKIRKQGLTYKEIAHKLNQDNVPTLSGQVGPSAWKEGAIGRILKS